MLHEHFPIGAFAYDALFWADYPYLPQLLQWLTPHADIAINFAVELQRHTGERFLGIVTDLIVELIDSRKLNMAYVPQATPQLAMAVLVRRRLPYQFAANFLPLRIWVRTGYDILVRRWVWIDEDIDADLIPHMRKIWTGHHQFNVTAKNTPTDFDSADFDFMFPDCDLAKMPHWISKNANTQNVLNYLSATDRVDDIMLTALQIHCYTPAYARQRYLERYGVPPGNKNPWIPFMTEEQIDQHVDWRQFQVSTYHTQLYRHKWYRMRYGQHYGTTMPYLSWTDLKYGVPELFEKFINASSKDEIGDYSDMAGWPTLKTSLLMDTTSLRRVNMRNTACAEQYYSFCALLSYHYLHRLFIAVWTGKVKATDGTLLKKITSLPRELGMLILEYVRGDIVPPDNEDSIREIAYEC